MPCSKSWVDRAARRSGLFDSRSSLGHNLNSFNRSPSRDNHLVSNLCIDLLPSIYTIGSPHRQPRSSDGHNGKSVSASSKLLADRGYQPLLLA